MNSLILYIKTLLCDLPIEDYIAMPSKRNNRLCKFCSVARWNNLKFTLAQLEALYGEVNERLKQDANISKHLCKDNEWLNIFHAVSLYTNETIKYVDGTPKVMASEILNWHELTKFLGEDLFTTIYAAARSKELNRKNLTFAWSDAIDIDDRDGLKISEVTDKGLADVHAHLFASADIANIRWIMLMNNPQDAKAEMGLLQRMTTTSWTSFRFSIDELIKIAAYLRFSLWLDVYKDEGKMIPAVIKEWQDCKGINDERIFDLTNEINSWRMNGLKLSNSSHTFDYAIREDILMEKQLQINSPFSLLQGERLLLFRFFRKFFRGNANKNLVQMMHLYLLIKSHVRQEFVQINNVEGLDNFMSYDGNRRQIIDYQLLGRYAVQSCLREDISDSFEARTVYNDQLQTKPFKWSENLLENRDCYNHNGIIRGLTFVATISKSLKMNEGYGEKCNIARKQMIDIVDRMTHQECDSIKVTGVDTLGNELKARPEMFRHAYKYARCHGVNNLTYHCGEDFYDLVDGLRAIDEAIRFLGLGRGNRLGHALALGIDARKYYERRHFTSPMPRRYALDNLSWLYYQLRGNGNKWYCQNLVDGMEYVEQEFKKLAPTVAITDYIESMELRGQKEEDITSDNQEAIYLYHEYKADKQADCISVEWNIQIVGIVDYVQQKMRRKIASLDIAIEACPSSNLAIGPFDKYEEHPMLRINRKGLFSNLFHKSISISINTDDRGIFSTSLPYEYAIMAIAMQISRDNKGRRRYSDRQILSFIRERKEDAERQKFVPLIFNDK